VPVLSTPVTNKFLDLLTEVFVEVFNIKLVENLLNQPLFKFDNFWLSRFSLVVEMLDLYPLKIWVNSN
jgi:hypothetical protein